MKDPNDTRDVTPRAGSPLWIHLTVVSVAGFAVLCVALARFRSDDLHLLARSIHLPLDPPVDAVAQPPPHMRAALEECGFRA